MFKQEWIIQEYTNKEKDFIVRLLKHDKENVYGIQTNRSYEIDWGYSKEGAEKTFERIVNSWKK